MKSVYEPQGGMSSPVGLHKMMDCAVFHSLLSAKEQIQFRLW